ncbi:unnamed protein product, partial [Vitis vinifera]
MIRILFFLCTNYCLDKLFQNCHFVFLVSSHHGLYVSNHESPKLPIMGRTLYSTMGACNTRMESHKLLSFHLFMISIFFFLIFFPSATSLSFNFSSFGSNDHNISFDEAGDAVYSSDGCIQLTRNENDKQSNDSWGRAMYSERLYLWDQTSRNLTDFTTNFSFVINSQDHNQYADGLTFFLNGTQLHTDTLGETLGLANEKNETNKSAVTDSTNTTQSLSYKVDLREYLPEYRNTERDQEDGGDSDLDMDEDFEKGTGPRKFSFNELALATSNFSEGEKLGEGGFGGVYRGFLRELNSYVAVKRVTRNSQQGMKEYASEVKIFCRLRHRNLVQLMGWYRIALGLASSLLDLSTHSPHVSAQLCFQPNTTFCQFGLKSCEPYVLFMMAPQLFLYNTSKFSSPRLQIIGFTIQHYMLLKLQFLGYAY